MRRLLARGEDGAAGLVLLAMVGLPLAALAARFLESTALANADAILRHLNLWLAFLGAAVAAREGRLLRLAVRDLLPAGAPRAAADAFAVLVGCATSALLAHASWELVRLEQEFDSLAFSTLPTWIVLLVLPVSFALVALRLAWGAGTGYGGAAARALRAAGLAGAVAGALAGHAAAARPETFAGTPAWPVLAVLLVAPLAGAPLFVPLGGAAVFLFLRDEVPAAVVPSEMYGLAKSPFLAALPLFTWTGYLMTLGRTPQRLFGVFRAWLGWLPGGTAIVSLVLCTFFTVFTGGSGVTILALGGLLLHALDADGYRERFSHGLLTAGGSLGLLFPPSLPLILYGIAAGVAIEDLFLGGLLPGAILLLLLAAWSLRAGRRIPRPREPFAARAAFSALWEAKLELLLPVLALVALFGGFATLVEAAALTSAYAMLVQLVVRRREVSLRRDFFPALRDCVAVLGGVLILLAVAKGLTNYLVDARVPAELLAFVRENVDSKVAFLLCLNLFLLVVGCFLDIYSATFVVVPLILPLGEAYGIHPVHLGIVFVANLELGYLTPPIGLNLFLASYRFERPLWAVYRAAVPFLLLLGAGVLVITYLPILSTAFL